MALTIPQYTKLSTNIFYLLTIIFFITKYSLSKAERDKNEWIYTMNNSKANMLNLFYLFLLIISQIFINNNISRIYCKKVQTYTVLKYTLLPNILIFGSLICILTFFPNWAMPFSNTIGYFIVSWGSKLKQNFLKLFNPGRNNKDLNFENFIKKKNTSIINQMNPDNFDKVVDDILKFNDLKKKNRYYNNSNTIDAYKYIYKYVCQKHLISHFIWFLLAGSYALTVSHGYIYNLQDSCS